MFEKNKNMMEISSYFNAFGFDKSHFKEISDFSIYIKYICRFKLMLFLKIVFNLYVETL